MDLYARLRDPEPFGIAARAERHRMGWVSVVPTIRNLRSLLGIPTRIEESSAYSVSGARRRECIKARALRVGGLELSALARGTK